MSPSDILSKDYDYALLKLEKKVVLPEYMTLEIDYKLDSQEKMQIFGYNQSSVFLYNNMDANQVGIIKEANKFQIKGKKLLNNISTMEGNSGSPITRVKKMGNKIQQVVSAIHKGSVTL